MQLVGMVLQPHSLKTSVLTQVPPIPMQLILKFVYIQWSLIFTAPPLQEPLFENIDAIVPQIYRLICSKLTLVMNIDIFRFTVICIILLPPKDVPPRSDR